MSLLEELASRECEKLTTRLGCLGYKGDERCDPCRARVELGLDPQAPRRCDGCHAVMVHVDWSGGIVTGTDAEGSHSCPAPLHKPHLFYEDRIEVRQARQKARGEA